MILQVVSRIGIQKTFWPRTYVLFWWGMVHFTGYINSQNNRYWSTENPHAVHEVPLHDWNLWFDVQLVHGGQFSLCLFINQSIPNVMLDWFCHPSSVNWLMMKTHMGILCKIMHQPSFTLCSDYTSLHKLFEHWYAIRQAGWLLQFLLWTVFCQVRFQVLTAASMKMVVFWVVVMCSLVEVLPWRWRQQAPLKRQ
jgi:hypothetical protein